VTNLEMNLPVDHAESRLQFWLWPRRTEARYEITVVSSKYRGCLRRYVISRGKCAQNSRPSGY